MKNTRGKDFDRFGTEWIRMQKAHYSLTGFSVFAKIKRLISHQERKTDEGNVKMSEM